MAKFVEQYSHIRAASSRHILADTTSPPQGWNWFMTMFCCGADDDGDEEYETSKPKLQIVCLIPTQPIDISWSYETKRWDDPLLIVVSKRNVC